MLQEDSVTNNMNDLSIVAVQVVADPTVGEHTTVLFSGDPFSKPKMSYRLFCYFNRNHLLSKKFKIAMLMYHTKNDKNKHETFHLNLYFILKQ